MVIPTILVVPSKLAPPQSPASHHATAIGNHWPAPLKCNYGYRSDGVTMHSFFPSDLLPGDSHTANLNEFKYVFTTL